MEPITLVCDACHQVAGAPMGVVLGDPGRRLGQYLLDIVLFGATLGIGWIVWSVQAWRGGQTPAMRLMKLQVLHAATRRPARWWRMFVRELLIKMVVMTVVGVGSFWVGTVLLDSMILWDRGRRQVWDEIADTIVVDTTGVPQYLLTASWEPEVAAPII